MRGAAVVIGLALAALVGIAAAPAATPPRCTSGGLRAWAGRSGVGLGTVYSEYGFVNVGRRTCVMRGFPSATMVDGSDHRMPTIVRRTTPGEAGYTTPSLVTLAKGGRAYFAVFYADGTGYVLGHCPTSVRLLLTPPGGGDGVVLRGPHARIAPYGGTVQDLDCGIVHVGPLTAAPLTR